MIYFTRRFNSDVWPQAHQEINAVMSNFAEISADPFSKCLKTDNGTLSLWKFCTADTTVNKDNLANSIMALVTAPNQKTLSPLDVIYFSEVDLQTAGLSINQTDGSTSITHLINTHFDIVDINYKKLENVGQLVLQTLLRDSIENFTKQEVIELLNSYLDLDIKNNYKNINDNILIFMGEATQRKLLDTNFYKDLPGKYFLDIKITVLNDLFIADSSLISQKIAQLNPREKAAFRVDVRLKSNSKSIYDDLISFVEERTN